jgi:hypothetical protein
MFAAQGQQQRQTWSLQLPTKQCTVYPIIWIVGAIHLQAVMRLQVQLRGVQSINSGYDSQANASPHSTADQLVCQPKRCSNASVDQNHAYAGQPPPPC